MTPGSCVASLVTLDMVRERDRGGIVSGGCS